MIGTTLVPSEEYMELILEYKKVSNEIDQHSKRLLTLEIKKEELSAKVLRMTYPGNCVYLKEEHVVNV